MMIRTSKACAGPAIERKPGANASNDIDSHLKGRMGGGVKSLTAKAQRTAASVNFLYPRKMKFNQE
ncbi:hypothetical protein HJX42_07350 [Klebsiella pneumoniae]|nr:hypothetical protein HJX42_07350 [Klebsiella pneumoniae]